MRPSLSGAGAMSSNRVGETVVDGWTRQNTACKPGASAYQDALGAGTPSDCVTRSTALPTSSTTTDDDTRRSNTAPNDTGAQDRDSCRSGTGLSRPSLCLADLAV